MSSKRFSPSTMKDISAFVHRFPEIHTANRHKRAGLAKIAIKKLASELRELLNLGLVTSYYFTKQVMHLTTRDIIFNGTRSNNFGTYELNITPDRNANELIIYNTFILAGNQNESAENHAHFMHIDCDGCPCLGSYSGYINQLCYERDWINLVNHLIMYLEHTYDPSDAHCQLGRFKQYLRNVPGYRQYVKDANALALKAQGRARIKNNITTKKEGFSALAKGETTETKQIFTMPTQHFRIGDIVEVIESNGAPVESGHIAEITHVRHTPDKSNFEPGDQYRYETWPRGWTFYDSGMRKLDIKDPRRIHFVKTKQKVIEEEKAEQERQEKIRAEAIRNAKPAFNVGDTVKILNTNGAPLPVGSTCQIARIGALNPDATFSFYVKQGWIYATNHLTLVKRAGE